MHTSICILYSAVVRPMLVVEYAECGYVGRQSKKRQKSDEETKKSSKKAKMTIEDIDEDDDDDESDAEVGDLLIT